MTNAFAQFNGGIMGDSVQKQKQDLVYMHALAGIGFGCMIGWDVIGLFSPVLPLLAFTDLPGALFLRSVGIAAIAVSYIVYRKFAGRIFAMRTKMSIVAGALSLPAAAMAAAHLVIDLPFTLDVIVWIAFGAGNSLMCVLWCSYLSMIPPKGTGFTVGGGAALGTVLFCIATCVQPMLLSLTLSALLVVATVSLLNLLFAQTPPERVEELSRACTPPAPLTLPAALSLATHGIVYGFITFRICSISFEAAVLVGGSGVIGSLCVVAVARFSKKFDFDNSLAQRVTQPIIVLGLLFMPMFDAPGMIVCGCIINNALAFMNIITWNSVCVENSEFHLQPIARFSGRQIPLWAGFLLGAVLMLAVDPLIAASETSGFFVTTVLASLVVIAFAIYGADDSEAKEQLENLMTVPEEECVEEETPDPLTFREICDEVGERYGLSPREKDVFYLLAKGRNAKYIQEELCISTSTVKTHIYRIYRKMGINSQQLLIDSVEDWKK